MRYFITVILASLLITIPSLAIDDVAKNSATYPAVKQAVDGGYLSLFGDEFKGNEPLSRTEFAIGLDKLLHRIETRSLELSDSDIQELLHLAKTFRSVLSDSDVSVQENQVLIRQLRREKQVLQDDLTKLQIELELLLEEQIKQDKEDKYWMWIGIIMAGIVGILV